MKDSSNHLHFYLDDQKIDTDTGDIPRHCYAVFVLLPGVLKVNMFLIVLNYFILSKRKSITSDMKVEFIILKKQPTALKEKYISDFDSFTSNVSLYTHPKSYYFYWLFDIDYVIYKHMGCFYFYCAGDATSCCQDCLNEAFIGGKRLKQLLGALKLIVSRFQFLSRVHYTEAVNVDV